jgi:hypothetical protein
MAATTMRVIFIIATLMIIQSVVSLKIRVQEGGAPLMIGDWTKKDRSSTEVRHIRISQTGANTM